MFLSLYPAFQWHIELLNEKGILYLATLFVAKGEVPVTFIQPASGIGQILVKSLVPVKIDCQIDVILTLL